MSLAYRTMVSGLFLKSPRKGQGPLSGMIGNSRSKGKMRISEHRSYVAVDKSKDRIRMLFGAERTNRTRADESEVVVVLLYKSQVLWMSSLLPCTNTY